MTTLVKIGNSHGLKIPKAIIKQANLYDAELKFKVIDKGLLIQPVKKARYGWKEQFDIILQSNDLQELDKDWLDAPLVEEDWEW